MKTIIEMAREAGFMAVTDDDPEVGALYECFTDELERFAELVRADERDRAMRENAYVLAEREACAKVCDEMDDDVVDGYAGWQYGEAIRARGNA